MKIKTLIMAGLILSGVLSTPAMAAKDPRPGPADARIKTLVYHENDVYRLRGHYGYTTVIEFSPLERIETASIGDSESWQIVKSNRFNILFIKPLEENAETDMTVLTSKRIYTFEMSAAKASSHQSSDLTFRLKFIYPGDTTSMIESSATPLMNSPVSAWNFSYSYAGAKRLRPERAFDDGTFTYLQFKAHDVTPAVFAVDDKGNESLVNFTVQGQYLVIARVGRQYTLRDGDTATCIFNDGFQDDGGTQTAAVPIDAMKEKVSGTHVPIPGRKPSPDMIAQDEGRSSFSAFLARNTSPPQLAGLNN